MVHQLWHNSGNHRLQNLFKIHRRTAKKKSKTTHIKKLREQSKNLLQLSHGRTLRT